MSIYDDLVAERGGFPQERPPREPTPGEIMEAGRATARVIKRVERNLLQAKKAAAEKS